MKASCQCGQLTAEVADDAQPMTIACHCTSCQKRSGSPFGMIAYFPKEGVTIAGEAKEFTRDTDTGSTFTTGFCPLCGSTVFALAARLPAIMGVTVGCISDPAFPPPNISVYEETMHHWVAMPAEGGHFERGTGGG